MRAIVVGGAALLALGMVVPAVRFATSYPGFAPNGGADKGVGRFKKMEVHLGTSEPIEVGYKRKAAPIAVTVVRPSCRISTTSRSMMSTWPDHR